MIANKFIDLVTKKKTRGIALAAIVIVAVLTAGTVFFAQSPKENEPQKPLKISHPTIQLLDARGVNVLKSNAPISTRKTCGKCHDYDFITDSFHFQQGRSERDNPDLLKAHGVSPFNVSPGMYGKYSVIPNRQLAHLGIKSPDDFDMGTADWLLHCGVCHTGGGISEFDSENRRYGTVDAKDIDPLDRDYHIRDGKKGKVIPWDWKKSGFTEGDCFLCHVPGANRGARRERVATGDFRWANNATLVGTGVVDELEDGTLTYNKEAFNPDGTVKSSVLDLSDPTLENCAQCHGFSARYETDIQPIQNKDILRGTEKVGWIYDGAKISDTVKPNIVDKDKKDYPWDVHAAKKLICIDCHFSPNNPGRKQHINFKENLRYKPSGEDIAVYLKRPDHNFARGNIPPETVNMTRHYTMRGCEDCHVADKIHKFLPYRRQHLKKLACQTCHIPKVNFWAYRSVDWGMLMDTGTSRITFRGIEGSIVDPDSPIFGYYPTYIPTKNEHGQVEIRPTNLITGTDWFNTDKGRPVYTWQMQKALFDHRDPDGTWIYRDKVVKMFGDEDGFIDIPQAVYDTPEKVALVKGLLQKYAGIKNPQLRITIVPWAMSHGIVGGKQAIRECTACHSSNSILHRPIKLNDAAPKGAPAFYGGKRMDVVTYASDGPRFNNKPLLSGFYIIGNSRVFWIELLGWLFVLGSLIFVLVHGALRLIVGGKS